MWNVSWQIENMALSVVKTHSLEKKTDPNLGTRGQSINLWSIVSKTRLMKIQRTKALVLLSQLWKVDMVSFKIKSWKHRDAEVFVSPGALFVGWMCSQIFIKSKCRVRPCGACMCLWVLMNQMRGMIPSAYLWADLQMLEVGSCLPLETLNWNVDTHTQKHEHTHTHRRSAIVFFLRHWVSTLTCTDVTTVSVCANRTLNTSSCCYLLLSVTSKQSCSDLQKEKEETRTSLEEALKTLKEQHKEELVQLEDRCGIHCDVPVSHTKPSPH